MSIDCELMQDVGQPTSNLQDMVNSCTVEEVWLKYEIYYAYAYA